MAQVLLTFVFFIHHSGHTYAKLCENKSHCSFRTSSDVCFTHIQQCPNLSFSQNKIALSRRTSETVFANTLYSLVINCSLHKKRWRLKLAEVYASLSIFSRLSMNSDNEILIKINTLKFLIQSWWFNKQNNWWKKEKPNIYPVCARIEFDGGWLSIVAGIACHDEGGCLNRLRCFDETWYRRFYRALFPSPLRPRTPQMSIHSL